MNNTDHLKSLRMRVFGYFKENKIDFSVCRHPYLALLFFYGLWMLAYVSILHVGNSSIFCDIIFLNLLIFATLGIALGIMHEASHHTFVKSKALNEWIGFISANVLLGVSFRIWRDNHILSHHQFTAIRECDGDYRSRAIFRIHHSMPHRFHHRFQHLYAFLLYSLGLLKTIYWDDIERGLLGIHGKISKVSLWLEIIFTKLFHIVLYIFIPYLIFKNIYFVLIGYFLFLFILSLIVLPLFIAGHIEGTSKLYSNADLPERCKQQIEASTNFSTQNKFLTWYTHGLNFHIEHHLFPTVAYCYLPLIQPIIKNFCKEYQLRYHAYTSLFSALRAQLSHFKKMAIVRDHDENF